MKLSLLSEIILKPAKSKVYFRLILVLYLLTVALISYSSVFILIKLVLITALTVCMRLEFKNQNPCFFIDEMSYRNKQWFVTMRNGSTQDCDNLRIIVHNTVFHLLQLCTPDKKKLLVLFNDQLSDHQVRQLHLLSSNR
ncbi:Uncharacterised protein [Legionella quateirensis]|uniref:Uncharacterized protein n=1 Tax=Legionella quateirensis TaxID=45072 RepID=A0A378KWM9_9GAMM|nr:hypothetical protein Lqua_1213 [Legionella quateirensis]STY17768.1 Uncharacterised protein [Legionella quateirensis]